jgi:hypothetical protein
MSRSARIVASYLVMGGAWLVSSSSALSFFMLVFLFGLVCAWVRCAEA